MKLKTDKDFKLLVQRLRDKDFRINNFYKIRNKSGDLIRFKRNPAQAHYNKNKHTRNIILKSRQLGFTTDACIDMLDDSVFILNYHGLIISYDRESSLDIFDNKVDIAWSNVPDTIKRIVLVDTNNARTLKFDQGLGNMGSIAVRLRGRSGTYSRIHVSEFGKICKESKSKANEIIAGTIPAVPVNGEVSIESTAEGEFGHFHDMFWEAWNRGEPRSAMEFKAHFYSWRWDLEEISKVMKMKVPNEFKYIQKQHDLTDQEASYYYQKWLSLRKDWHTLHQEYPLTPEEAFVSSGYKVFNWDLLKNHKVLKGKEVGDWVVFEDYDSNCVYAMGCDVAEGVGQDSSTAVIINFTKKRVAARFSSNTIPPDLFSWEIKRMAEKFGNCLVAVERNSVGAGVIYTLKNIYWNLYQEERTEGILDEETKKLGWLTTKYSKPRMISDLRRAIDDGEIWIPDKKIIEELRTYDKQDLSQVNFNPDQTRHWDLVVALAICLQMATHVAKPATDSPSKSTDFNRFEAI